MSASKAFGRICALVTQPALADVPEPSDVAQVMAALSQGRSDARVLWAVRVLDAWRTGNYLRQHVERSADKNGMRCEVELYFERLEAREYHYGADPDAARLAAAEAIWHELPADVRQALGERP